MVVAFTCCGVVRGGESAWGDSVLSTSVLITRGNTPAWTRVTQRGCASFLIATVSTAVGGHEKEYSW